MSANFDATNFNYAPADGPTPTMAMAGNTGPAGLVGDVITSLVPYNDDLLILGGDRSISVMRGDPAAGGEIDILSDTIGMAWGRPWARDPYGAVYFVSNQLGIYRYVPGQALSEGSRISQPIEQLLEDYNTGTTTIRALWDDNQQGVHFFFSPTAAPAATTHLFWEQRTGAWWTDVFANTSHDPLCCCTFDGNTATDRVALIGSWDGYVRYFNQDATADDGSTLTSSVFIGPINSKDLDTILLKDLQAELGSNSGSVTWSVHTGATAEAAFAASAVASGTWTAGRSQNTLVRQAAHSLWLKLTATGGWSMEKIRARLTSLGKVQRRKA